MTTENQRSINLKTVLLLVVLFIAFITSAFLRVPKPDSENWLNSDATYHVLLTINAFDETPIRQHKFLPLVSLGQMEDKFIPWGAAIPDKFGNYYYTSFPSLGFVVPYVTMKILRLPFTETGLYIFNSILFLLSWIAVTYLFVEIFKSKLNRHVIIAATSLIYLFSMETMHSQGVTYWSQSLFQLFFIVQCILFLKRKTFRWGFGVFIGLFIIAPLIEWTGYVSNVGFVIAYAYQSKLIMRSGKNFSVNRSVFCRSIGLLSLLALSAILYYLHFVTAVSSVDFLRALHARFFARNFTSTGGLRDLFKGYITSFGAILGLNFALLLLLLINNRTRNCLLNRLAGMPLFFILFFTPLLENVIMKQHAIAYTFDRLKLVFAVVLLSLIILETIEQCIRRWKWAIRICLLLAMILISVVNLKRYVSPDYGYRKTVASYALNPISSSYIKMRFNRSNSVIGQQYPVRGYTNLLFMRGIYECNEVAIQDLARKKAKRYAVFLDTQLSEWDKYNYTKFKIFDLDNGVKISVHFDNGRLVESRTSY